MRMIGLDADAVFTHPDIRAWRTLSDRENCTLDVALPDGRPIRLHIKRYPPSRGRVPPAEQEVRAIELLNANGIPTVPLIAFGTLPDRRSFIITEDLAGYQPADKFVKSEADFQAISQPTADLAARLHSAKLHHRDLYLCHFFINPSAPADIRLIDPARVAALPRLFARRWIVKDLAQFCYSTFALPVSGEQRFAWLDRYSRQRGLDGAESLWPAVFGKMRWIARHDARLRHRQPGRNISIPC
jgi:hypothetical protein